MLLRSMLDEEVPELIPFTTRPVIMLQYIVWLWLMHCCPVRTNPGYCSECCILSTMQATSR